MKRFCANGKTITVDEEDFRDVKGLFKEDVVIINVSDWDNVPKYNAKEFLAKADMLFHENDFVQAHEKLWAAASYALKEVCLQCGIKLASYNAKRFAANTMMQEAKKLDLRYDRDYSMYAILRVGWRDAQSCHSRFNELSSVDDEEWENEFQNVTSFIDAVEKLSKNDTFKSAFSAALIRPQNTIQIIQFDECDETLGETIYKINCELA